MPPPQPSPAVSSATGTVSTLGSRSRRTGSHSRLTRAPVRFPYAGRVQHLYDFLRRHPTGVDSFWALVLSGLSVLWVATVPGGPGGPGGPGEPVAAAVALLFGLVVALRRRMPERMLLLAVALGGVQLLVDLPPNPADFAMLVAIYSVAAHDGPRWASRLALAGGACAATVSQLRWPMEHISATGRMFSTVVMSVPFVLAWVLGDSMRTRRAYLAQLEERADRLEREREARAKVAVAAERARIARELHDVVAHNVSVMVVRRTAPPTCWTPRRTRRGRRWRPSPPPAGRPRGDAAAARHPADR